MVDHNQDRAHRQDSDHLENERPLEQPAADQLFSILADRTSRRLLFLLLDGSHSTIDDAAEALVGLASTAQREPLGPDEREQAKIQLYHHQLPKLTEVGIVRHDAEAEEIRLVGLSESARESIRLALDYDDQLPYERP